MYNFSPGPAVLPFGVREEIAAAVSCSPGDVSIIESSHRGKAYGAVHAEAMEVCRRLYAVPDNMAILFLQGGATLQFAMVPQNLVRPGRSAAYVITGSWAQKALAEARILGGADPRSIHRGSLPITSRTPCGGTRLRSRAPFR